MLSRFSGYFLSENEHIRRRDHAEMNPGVPDPMNRDRHVSGNGHSLAGVKGEDAAGEQRRIIDSYPNLRMIDRFNPDH